MKGRRARWVRERDTTAHSSASNCFEKHVGESSSILADALELGEAVVGEAVVGEAVVTRPAQKRKPLLKLRSASRGVGSCRGNGSAVAAQLGDELALNGDRGSLYRSPHSECTRMK